MIFNHNYGGCKGESLLSPFRFSGSPILYHLPPFIGLKMAVFLIKTRIALIAWDCDTVEFNNDNTQQLGLNLKDIVNSLKAINI